MQKQMICVVNVPVHLCRVQTAIVFASITKLQIRIFNTQSEMALDYSRVIYKSLNSVLEHLNNFTHLNAVTNALEVYEKISIESQALDEKRYPLIVVEGLDGCGKTTATKRLSRTLNAVLFCTPPPCLREIRAEFDKPEYSNVRAAFYSLGNYVAAIQMKTMLKDRAVVLDRFWHSTAAYALAQYVCDNPDSDLPIESDLIYDWPKDLIQPDVIAYLCVNEQKRLERIRNRPEFTDQENLLAAKAKFRSDVVKVYNRITPKLKYINGQMSKRKVEEQILVHARPLIPQKSF